jgi:ApaG protein
MSIYIADKILIEVKTKFNETQSNIDDDTFFFNYHIVITNNSPFSVQLLSRKWIINDSNGDNKMVEGMGVVGEQPVIEPNQSYEYYSGCILKTGFGKMHGEYTFLRLLDEELFDVKIPSFHFVLPWVLN